MCVCRSVCGVCSRGVGVGVWGCRSVCGVCSRGVGVGGCRSVCGVCVGLCVVCVVGGWGWRVQVCVWCVCRSVWCVYVAGWGGGGRV